MNDEIPDSEVEFHVLKCLEGGARTIEEVARDTGIAENRVKRVIDRLNQTGFLHSGGAGYSLHERSINRLSEIRRDRAEESRHDRQMREERDRFERRLQIEIEERQEDREDRVKERVTEHWVRGIFAVGGVILGLLGAVAKEYFFPPPEVQKVQIVSYPAEPSGTSSLRLKEPNTSHTGSQNRQSEITGDTRQHHP